MAELIKLKNKSWLRRHPLWSLLVISFFTFSLVLIAILHWSAAGNSPKRRSRGKVNTYRLPADFSFAAETAGLTPVAITPPDAHLPPAVDNEIEPNTLLYNAITMAVAVTAAILISLMLTKLLIH